MAVIKNYPLGAGDPPRVNQRIDGVIQTFNRQTNTLNSWHYPKQDQTSRFLTVNGNAQRLDQQFADLSPTDQATWDAFFDMDFWSLLCWIWDENQMPMPPDSPGLAAYRATNLSRIDQGLALTVLPPFQPAPIDSSPIVFSGPPLSFKYDRPGTPPPPNFFASIYGRPTNTEPSPGEQPDKKLIYITSFNIVPLTVYDISGYIAASRIMGNSPWEQVEVRVGFRGGPARVRNRTSS